MVAAVQHQGLAVPVQQAGVERHLRRVDEVAQPELDRVHAERPGCPLQRPLHREDRFGPAGAPVGGGGDLVCG